MKRKIRIEITREATGDVTASNGTMQDIDVELLAVNGRAEKHTIRSAQEVIDLVDEAEAHLDYHDIPKVERGGITVKYRPAGPDSKSYKYCATSTMVTLRRNAGSQPVWYVVALERVDVYPREKRLFKVEVSDETMRNIVHRALREFGRHEMPKPKPAPLAAVEYDALARLAA